MNNLKAPYFFDLQTYRHAQLFKDSDFVWNALSLIPSYLASIKLGQIEIKVPEGAFIVDAHLISIGKGTIVEPGAYIRGPCIIGEYCTIRHGAYIRGNVIVGNKCVIGHDSEVKSTILLDNAHAAHFAYLGDSILGNHVNLGAGTKCANLKLENKMISVYVDGNHIETGLHKFGAIIGDHTQIGCNAVTNPGTLLGKNVLCYPCINASGYVPSNSLIKSTASVSIIPRSL